MPVTMPKLGTGGATGKPAKPLGGWKTLKEVLGPRPCCTSKLHFMYCGISVWACETATAGGEKPGMVEESVAKLWPLAKPWRNAWLDEAAVAKTLPGSAGETGPATVKLCSKGGLEEKESTMVPGNVS